MKLLLDTHIWLWNLLEPEKLVARVARALENPANEAWLSPVSIWELVILVEKRRVFLELPIAAWIQEAGEALPFREAAVTAAVALEMSRVALPQKDPADRLLVATARVFGLTLVTADEHLLGAKGIEVLPNR